MTVLETPEQIEACRSFRDLMDLAKAEANSELFVAAITAAYYIGHENGGRSMDSRHRFPDTTGW